MCVCSQYREGGPAGRGGSQLGDVHRGGGGGSGGRDVRGTARRTPYQPSREGGGSNSGVRVGSAGPESRLTAERNPPQLLYASRRGPTLHTEPHTLPENDRQELPGNAAYLLRQVYCASQTQSKQKQFITKATFLHPNAFSALSWPPWPSHTGAPQSQFPTARIYHRGQ